MLVFIYKYLDACNMPQYAYICNFNSDTKSNNNYLVPRLRS